MVFFEKKRKESIKATGSKEGYNINETKQTKRKAKSEGRRVRLCTVKNNYVFVFVVL